MPFGPDRQLPSDFVVTPITSRKPRHKLTGRPLGAKSKFTTDLKAAVLEAAANVGDDQGRQGLVAFLEDSARKHRKAYLMLLAKLLPYHLTGTAIAPPLSVNIIGVPSDNYLSAADIKKLTALDVEPELPAIADRTALEAPAKVVDEVIEPSTDETAPDLVALKEELKAANELLGRVLNNER